MAVTLGTTPFEVRSGVFGDTQAPFNPLGVKQMSGGKVRLELTRENGEWRSAGILGPIIEAGKTYSLEILGRLDNLDPRVCFAVWGNGPNGEVDFLEAMRPDGDPNKGNYTSGYWLPGDTVQSGSLVDHSTAFDRHLLTVKVMPTGIVMRAFGVQGLRTVEVAAAAFQWVPHMTFRVALWVPKTGPLYSASRDRGPLTIDVRGFAVG